MSLRRSQAKALARLHNVADVRIGDLGELVWARGTGTESEVEHILTRVPSSRFFEVVHHDRLRPRGRLLPTARLPDVRWVPLPEWLSIRIPTPALPGERRSVVHRLRRGRFGSCTASEWPSIRIPTPALPGELSGSAELRLVVDHAGPTADSGEELLLCKVQAFREFLLRNPLHRLRPLRFVVNDARSEVLVRGNPLPSIPGERFVLQGGIATPVGRAWSPPVGASVIRAWLGLRDGTMALWRADGADGAGGGGISEIDEDAFVAASRRAGRKL